MVPTKDQMGGAALRDMRTGLGKTIARLCLKLRPQRGGIDAEDVEQHQPKATRRSPRGVSANRAGQAQQHSGDERHKITIGQHRPHASQKQLDAQRQNPADNQGNAGDAFGARRR